MKTMIRRFNVYTEKNLIQEINHLYYENMNIKNSPQKTLGARIFS